MAVSDFNDSARISLEQIKSDLTEMKRIRNFVKENKTRTRQETNTRENSWNLNHSSEDDSQDEDFERLKMEFNLINQKFFQCLESHR